jgi:thioredoxin 2
MSPNSTASEIVRCSSCGKKNRVPAAAQGVPRCGNCHTALPWITEADEDSFAAVVEHAALPVLLDLWAPWCGPCQMVTPALEQLAITHAGRVKLVKVNVDDAPRVAARFSAQAIPTLIVLKNGQAVARQIGAAPAPVLKRWLENALDSIPSESASSSA